MFVSTNPNGSSLCLACGLCCNGALHAHTIVKPNEIDTVRALGLTIETHGDQLFFRQPCPLYREQRCSAYPNHPPTCRAYQCALLKKYHAGEITFEQSEKIVQRAQELYVDVLEQLPNDYSFDQLKKEMAQDGDFGSGLFGSPELRQANAEFLLTVAKLTMFLRKHFEKPKKGGGDAESVKNHVH
ncbi:conserved hypothetical protein [Gammaproteobacteria bacterium]